MCSPATVRLAGWRAAAALSPNRQRRAKARPVRRRRSRAGTAVALAAVLDVVEKCLDAAADRESSGLVPQRMSAHGNQAGISSQYRMPFEGMLMMTPPRCRAAAV